MSNQGEDISEAHFLINVVTTYMWDNDNVNNTMLTCSC